MRALVAIAVVALALMQSSCRAARQEELLGSYRYDGAGSELLRSTPAWICIELAAPSGFSELTLLPGGTIRKIVGVWTLQGSELSFMPPLLLPEMREDLRKAVDELAPELREWNVLSAVNEYGRTKIVISPDEGLALKPIKTSCDNELRNEVRARSAHPK